MKGNIITKLLLMILIMVFLITCSKKEEQTFENVSVRKMNWDQAQASKDFSMIEKKLDQLHKLIEKRDKNGLKKYLLENKRYGKNEHIWYDSEEAHLWTTDELIKNIDLSFIQQLMSEKKYQVIVYSPNDYAFLTIPPYTKLRNEHKFYIELSIYFRNKDIVLNNIDLIFKNPVKPIYNKEKFLSILKESLMNDDENLFKNLLAEESLPFYDDDYTSKDKFFKEFVKKGEYERIKKIINDDEMESKLSWKGIFFPMYSSTEQSVKIEAFPPVLKSEKCQTYIEFSNENGLGWEITGVHYNPACED